MTFHFSCFPCSSMSVHFVLASPLIRGILCAARSRPLVLFPVSATFTLMYVCVCNIKFIFKYSIIHFALYVYFLCVYKCKRESALRTGIFTEMLTFNCHSCGCALSRVYAMETFRWLFLRVCMFKWMHLLFSVLPACRVSMRTCHGTPTRGHLLSLSARRRTLHAFQTHCRCEVEHRQKSFESYDYNAFNGETRIDQARMSFIYELLVFNR